MNIYLILGIAIVNLALISYSVFFFMKKEEYIRLKHMLFLSAGVFFDFFATLLMITGSSRGILTFHGLIGYSALVGMIIEAVLMWRVYIGGRIISRGLTTLTRTTYLWWVFVYVVGFIMIMLKG